MHNLLFQVSPEASNILDNCLEDICMYTSQLIVITAVTVITDTIINFP